MAMVTQQNMTSYAKQRRNAPALFLRKGCVCALQRTHHLPTLVIILRESGSTPARAYGSTEKSIRKTEPGRVGEELDLCELIDSLLLIDAESTPRSSQLASELDTICETAKELKLGYFQFNFFHLF